MMPMDQQSQPAFRKLPLFRAFAHVFATVRNNWRHALRLALPWLFVIAIANWWAIKSAPAYQPIGPSLANWSLADFAAILVGIVGSTSVAVSWHRFVLLNESTHDVPAFRLDRLVITYLLTSLGLAFAFSLPIVALSLIAVGLPPVVLTMITAISVMLLILLIRLSLKLVAIALGRDDYSLKQGYDDTRGNNARILGLFLLLVVASILAMILPLLLAKLINALVPGTGEISAFLLSQPAQFLTMMISISMLTTLFGFCAERRDF